VKFFLEAPLAVRARRRHLELNGRSDQTLDAVLKDMQQRDHNDQTRDLAPLKPALDAIVIDSENLTPDEVVDRMLQKIKMRGGGSKGG